MGHALFVRPLNSGIVSYCMATSGKVKIWFSVPIYLMTDTLGVDAIPPPPPPAGGGRGVPMVNTDSLFGISFTEHFRGSYRRTFTGYTGEHKQTQWRGVIDQANVPRGVGYTERSLLKGT